MNVLVTGSNGNLGCELRRLAADSTDRFVFTDIGEMPGAETIHLDITNEEALEIIVKSEKIDVIVNCAAYTNVDKAEDDVEFAAAINRDAPESMARIAKAVGATLIHISTDYVFSGEGNTPIKETVSPAPRSVYGSTKLAGEKAIQKSGCKYIILRTAWLYSPYGKNFVGTMRSIMSSREEVRVVCDQVGSPTSAADLAGLIMHIISTRQLGKTGLYHFSGEGAVSWFDFAMAIKELCGYTCRVIPCLTSDYSTKARRPQYSVLDKSLVKKTFGVEIPYWRDSLEQCLKRI
ncbi:MAG: dTDP-4-dehydrorhamnose reductase [Bacteroidales bacterium]|nr:dTDP-4-dehydrorhamnose reductase [Bacteroidales bacterium]